MIRVIHARNRFPCVDRAESFFHVLFMASDQLRAEKALYADCDSGLPPFHLPELRDKRADDTAERERDRPFEDDADDVREPHFHASAKILSA